MLEATVLGPTIEFMKANTIAITGGDFSAKVNGNEVNSYEAIVVNTGDTLSFGMPKVGCRCYIAFSGGLAIESVMHSKSTNQKCSVGGLGGRKLGANDEIEFVSPRTRLPK